MPRAQNFTAAKKCQNIVAHSVGTFTFILAIKQENNLPALLEERYSQSWTLSMDVEFSFLWAVTSDAQAMNAFLYLASPILDVSF